MNRQISILSDGFDWDLLHDGKVVDIGGGNGHVSIALAQVSFQGQIAALCVLELQLTAYCD